MISSRLTKIQKTEILYAYKAGVTTNSLAEKYSCTTNTIIRTVKTLVSDGEYKLLKDKRSKINNKKVKIIDKDDLIDNKKDLNMELDDNIDRPKVKKIVSSSYHDQNGFNDEAPSENNNQDIDNNFELIEPLLSSFDFDHDKDKSDFEILNYESLPESLPESVYMIVDKKVELDLKLISDLPDWSFLPVNELKRNAILLFANQRSAKRNCSRNQRVIKIPNTSIFKLSQSYLISKGITRLIIEDSMIALDN
tara:strand:+ start:63 stop:815 length:753 start_codon:yes stop_codon:yes gene_type:complete